MLMRTLDYTVQGIRAYQLQHPNKPAWPPVLSIVIYNGAEPWNVSQRISDHYQALHPTLTPHLLQHSHQLIDIRRQSPLHLDKLNSVLALLMRFEQPDPKLDGRQLLSRLKAMLPTQHDLRRHIGIFITEVVGNSSNIANYIAAFVEQKETAMSIADHFVDWEKIAHDKGQAKGIRQGISQGRQDVLIKQLTKRFGQLTPQVLGRLQKATAAQLNTWAENFVDAQTLAQVFRKVH